MNDSSTGRIEIAITDLTRTRAHELIKMQQQDADSDRTFFSIFKRKAVDKETHLLSYHQLFIFYLLVEVPLSQLHWNVMISRQFGGISVFVLVGAFISQIIITIIIHFPLFLLFTTMAYYSKMGYIKFWDCLPINQGLAYVTAVVTLLMEMSNVSGAGLTILYIYESFFNIPWKDCNFDGATENCIPQNPEYDVPLNNCEFASIQYNKYNKRNIFHDTELSWYKFGSIKIDWAATVWFCCLVVCISSVAGLKKCASCLHKMLLMAIFGLSAPMSFISIVYSVFNGRKIFSMFKDLQHLFSAELWVQGILVNLPSNSPGVLLYLSSVSPDKMKNPVATAFKVLLSKSVISTLYLSWYSYTADQLLTTYNVYNTTCLEEFEMLQFTIFTDILTLLPLPFIWLNLHYMLLLIIQLSAPILAVTATVNSICQSIPAFNKYRFHLCVIICISMGCLTMIFTTTRGAMVYDKLLNRGLAFSFLIIDVGALCGIVFIYGVKTLKHDILFIYGNTLIPLFWFSITLLPIVFMLILVYIVPQSLQDNVFIDKISLYIVLIITSPLLIVPFYQIFQNTVGKSSQSLFTSRKSWGVERKLRKARETFNPDKEVEYNSLKLKCDHFCLVDSTRYKREVFTQTMLYQSLHTQMAEIRQRQARTNV